MHNFEVGDILLRLNSSLYQINQITRNNEYMVVSQNEDKFIVLDNVGEEHIITPGWYENWKKVGKVVNSNEEALSLLKQD